MQKKVQNSQEIWNLNYEESTNFKKKITKYKTCKKCKNDNKKNAKNWANNEIKTNLCAKKNRKKMRKKC